MKHTIFLYIAILMSLDVLGVKNDSLSTLDMQEKIIQDLSCANVDIMAYSARAEGFTICMPDINSVCEDVSNKIKSNRTVIVLFNESFFGSDILDKDKSEQLINKIRTVSLQHQNALLCINFTIRFNALNRPTWLPGDTGIAETINEDLITIGETPPSSGLVSLFCNAELYENRVANCSLMIWNGKIILFYRKSTYFKECDELCLEKENDMLIKGKYSYEFGDWKTHIATNEHTKFADALKNLVFFRTCSDIPCITGIESRSAVCLVLANKVAAGSINPPIYLKK